MTRFTERTIRASGQWVKITRDNESRTFTFARGYEGDFKAHEIETLTFKWVADNSGMITRLTTRNSFKIPYPNSTLDPDWDVIEEIYLTTQQIGGTHIYQHVKGHQDSGSTPDELTTEAKANIDAVVIIPTMVMALLSTAKIEPNNTWSRSILEPRRETNVTPKAREPR